MKYDSVAVEYFQKESKKVYKRLKGSPLNLEGRNSLFQAAGFSKRITFSTLCAHLLFGSTKKH